jgi:transcriptional regulator of acetoin/glycerol metabolism
VNAPAQRLTAAAPVADPSPAAVGQGEIGEAELQRLAASFHGTRKALARQAGLSERTLYRRLKALGLV